MVPAQPEKKHNPERLDMFVRHMTPRISTETSRPAAKKRFKSGGTYFLRRLARFFAVVGFTTVVYASALLAIALDSAIIEF